MKVSKNQANAPRILVVGPNWVGDMVMAQSLFITLKRRYPACRIDVLAPTWTLPLLSLMPEVSAAITMPLGRGQLGLAVRYRMGRQLRQANYDQAILLPNSFKSALIPFFAKIPRRIGYVGEQRWGVLNDVRRLDKNALPMTVQRFVALGVEEHELADFQCPLPKLQINPQQLAATCAKFSLASRPKKILGLCPGAEYGPAKCWPAEHFAAVARNKMQAGWDVWLFGSAKDWVVAEEINRATGDACINFAGLTSLAEAVDILSLCDGVVSNDSGLMHVAAALERSVVAIYGSSDPGFTPPLSSRARILSLNLDCSPCFKRTCPLGHYRCLQDVRPERVLAELDGI